jgi:hypothetical protein
MRVLLRELWNKWKSLGKFVGDAIARLVLSASYFSVFAPFGAGVRLFADPLDMKVGLSPRWLERQTDEPDLESARGQG